MKQHQADPAEPAHQKAADVGRVVDAEQLGRQHEPEPAARAEEPGGVDGERRPRGRQSRQRDARAEGCTTPSGPGRAREVLIPHVRRIAHDGVKSTIGRHGEEVAHRDLRPMALRLQKRRRGPGARGVQFMAAQVGLRRAQAAKALRCGQEEGRFATTGFQHPVAP